MDRFLEKIALSVMVRGTLENASERGRILKALAAKVPRDRFVSPEELNPPRDI